MEDTKTKVGEKTGPNGDLDLSTCVVRLGAAGRERQQGTYGEASLLLDGASVAGVVLHRLEEVIYELLRGG